MSVVKIQGNASGTGIFTIASPNSNNTRTMTLSDTNGTIYIAPGDGIQALASGVPAARSIAAGTGISVSNGDGVSGNPTITNTGVTSVTAGSNISVSASTGGVTISSTAGAPTTAQVLSATAGAAVGDVGSYAFLSRPAGTNATHGPGTTLAGSSLRYAGGLSAWNTMPGSRNGISGTTPSGTWRSMGNATGNYACCGGSYQTFGTLWLRIS